MAKFKKGQKRPENAGRKKGTPNKLNLGVEQALNARGVDCVEEMLKIAETTDKEEIRLTVYKELLKYIYPQRKAVEMGGIDGAGLEVKITRKEV